MKSSVLVSVPLNAAKSLTQKYTTFVCYSVRVHIVRGGVVARNTLVPANTIRTPLKLCVTPHIAIVVFVAAVVGVDLSYDNSLNWINS